MISLNGQEPPDAMGFRGCLPPPDRSSPGGGTIIVISLLVFSAALVSPGESGWTAGCCTVLAVAAVFAGSLQALHLSLFVTAATAAPLVGPFVRIWPLPLLIPLLVYFSVVLPVPRLRRSLRWLRPGRMGKDILLLVGATAVFSGAALYLWYAALRPDLSRHLGFLPAVPAWTYLLLGPGFAVLNAALEEAAVRGIVMDATDSAFGPGAGSLLMQAGLFGAMHYLQGFPRGSWGLMMTFLYGIMLGHIRRRSRGMLAPWLAHVCADLVIFAILASVMLGKAPGAVSFGR